MRRRLSILCIMSLLLALCGCVVAEVRPDGYYRQQYYYDYPRYRYYYYDYGYPHDYGYYYRYRRR